MNKFEKARKILQDLNIDSWLIVSVEDSDINSRFLLGVESHARHYIHVVANGKHEILAVEMEAPMIKKSLTKKNIDADVKDFNSHEDLIQKLKKILKKGKVALNYGENIISPKSTSFADYIKAGDYLWLKENFPKIKFVSAANIIYELRSVKTDQELKDLRETCKATMEILERIPDWVQIGMTERDLKAKIDYEYSRLGRSAFETIIASGANSADPHHNTSLKKIENGVLLIDTGLQIDEMCSDITWTFWVGSNPPEEFLNAYQAIYDAKIEAAKYYVDGVQNNMPAKKCREFLEKEGYDHKKLFFHGLGHSLGFEIHDIGMPISWKVPDEYKLKKGMVYTNEPGLYWQEKWGIRLEDDIIIGKEKCEQVTNVPKEPIVI